jgi:uncharacterized protein (DUF924 family)
MQSMTLCKALHCDVDTTISAFNMAANLPLRDEILEFWFGRPDTPGFGEAHAEWFRKDAAFDAALHARFGSVVDAALAGGFAEWVDPRGTLARVLLLDQFTRNNYRDTPRAFAGDALALSLAQQAVARQDDAALIPVERWFLYMPFEHAETMSAQEQSVNLFARLEAESGMADLVVWAERHAAVIRRFGRFPHRNAILGRASTPEEVAFLATPGSRF